MADQKQKANAQLKSLNPKWDHVEIKPNEDLLLGRVAGECQVSFPNDKLISSKHCRIYKESGAFFVEDLSSNGTFVNGTKVGKNQRCILKDGDELSLVIPNSEVAKKRPQVAETFIAYIFRESPDDEDPIYKDFDITRDLGTGNFAVVKLGVNKRTGEKVAVKVIDKRKFSLNPALRKDQLMDEVNVMRTMSHPNILSIKDLYESDDRLYLVLELVSGGDLFDAVVNREHYTEEESLQLFGQLASAVGYLHDHGVAHRDLKPENILMADSLTIKLSDFGLSKIIGEEQLMKTLCGTPQYLAPEIIFASEGTTQGGYSKAVDVWSMGVILYILLVGFPPFGENSFEDIKKGKYSLEDPAWETVSDHVKDLIGKMLTVNPKKRYTIDQIFAHPWMKPFQRVQGVPVVSAVDSNSTTATANNNNNNNNNNGKEEEVKSSNENSGSENTADPKEEEQEEEEEEEPSTPSKKRKTTTNNNNNNSKKSNNKNSSNSPATPSPLSNRRSKSNTSTATTATTATASPSIRSRYQRKTKNSPAIKEDNNEGDEKNSNDNDTMDDSTSTTPTNNDSKPKSYTSRRRKSTA